MDRHQLQRRAALRRLRLAGLERRVGQERGERIGGAFLRAVGGDVVGVGRVGGDAVRQHRRVGGDLGLADEALRGVDELLQVVDAVLAVLLGPVVRDEARRLDHVLDRLGQRQPRGRGAHRLDRPDERGETAARLAGQRARARRLPQRRALAAGRVLQRFERARADAARREIHDAQERAVVAGGGDQPQVGERVLDLGALEEPHPAVDAVRHAGIEQRVLEHPRLRVAAVEDRDLVERHAVGPGALDHVDDERGLVEVRGRGERAHRLALGVRGPEVLAEPRLVVADERVGGVEDVAVRAVVLLELDQAHRRPRRGEVALEVLHVGDVGAAERVDRLVVVADREHRGLGAGELAQPLVLQHVGVLELVDQQVREPAPVVVAQPLVPREQLVASQQQLGEVDDALALAHRLVQRVVLDLAACELVAGLDRVRAQPLLLGAGDEPLQLLRREALVVDVVRLVHPLDQRQLVLRVHDLEQLRQVRLAVVRAEHPVAQAVEGADPHAAGVDRRQRGQPDQHLLRRLVGEGDREDRQRRSLPGREQPGDTRGQHPGLAAAGAGEDQRRLVRQRDGLELFRIEVGEERRGHAQGEWGSARDYSGPAGAIIGRPPTSVRPTRMPRAPDATPPVNSATMRAFVHWIRAAAPYVHAFRGRTFVIAFGGEVVADDSFLGVVHDLNLLHSLGIRLVVVHGCRPQIEAILAQQGFESRYPTACGSPTPTRWTACSRPPARCARGSRRCCRWGSPIRRWRARASACRPATTSRPSRWASSTASTCSTPARCGASTARRSSSGPTTATSC